MPLANARVTTDGNTVRTPRTLPRQPVPWTSKQQKASGKALAGQKHEQRLSTPGSRPCLGQGVATEKAATSTLQALGTVEPAEGKRSNCFESCQRGLAGVETFKNLAYVPRAPT